MKLSFWLGIIGLILFEAANVYFIMPMPGSQEINSIELAYFLYSWRWWWRALFVILILLGLIFGKWKKRKYLLLVPAVVAGVIIYMTNFVMAADHMFYQPSSLRMVKRDQNKVDSNRLVIGINYNDEARAYPIQFIGYHHQVVDTIAGKPIIVTYCTVCRTGRVFEPLVNGKPERFRLVGMDHFNAMFEDESTKSWWRQVSGEAIAGKLKGRQLPELLSRQTSLAEWLRMNPHSLIMQGDPAYTNKYDSSFDYESGKSKKALTGTDSSSWNQKSWVIGIKAGDQRRAYDWNKLVKERMIQDMAGTTPVLLVISSDNKSFFAFERPGNNTFFEFRNDSLYLDGKRFRIDGRGIDTSFSLKPLPAYQEFWHSWNQFNPNTTRN
jgi:hypothetical protein